MKKLAHYIYHFFYLAFHWNLWLASFITWHEIKRGPKYGVNTVMPEKLKNLTIPTGDISKSSPYEPVSYYLLEKILTAFRKISVSTSIVDLGCGKGRVMVASAYFGFISITGIDFAKELCAEAEKNMQKVEQKVKGLKWEVICCNVPDYELQDTDSVFFLFNPFNAEILELFLQRLEKSLLKTPRPVYFLYASPLHINTLKEHGYEIMARINPGRKLEGAILKKLV